MLGSVYDADDALQDTLLRAWRGAAGLRDADSARAWLYSIATNVCLTELGRRRKRVLPHDFGPAADAGTPPGLPMVESTWIEPYPDQAIGLTDRRVTPECSYEQREAVELAFVAALQHLAANQRAALLLREVMGFSAKESAEMLQTTVASVNSALQRARASVAERVPPHTQQATLRSLGNHALQQLVGRYVDAWERCDVDGFTSLLVSDASFAMPPLATWYSPRDRIARWAREFSLSGDWRWKTVLSQANGQPALAFYAWDEPTSTHLPFALNVLSVRDDLVSDVSAFIVRAPDAAEPVTSQRLPEQPAERRSLAGAFQRFGLPAHLTA